MYFLFGFVLFQTLLKVYIFLFFFKVWSRHWTLSFVFWQLFLNSIQIFTNNEFLSIHIRRRHFEVGESNPVSLYFDFQLQWSFAYVLCLVANISQCFLFCLVSNLSHWFSLTLCFVSNISQSFQRFFLFLSLMLCFVSNICQSFQCLFLFLFYFQPPSFLSSSSAGPRFTRNVWCSSLSPSKEAGPPLTDLLTTFYSWLQVSSIFGLTINCFLACHQVLLLVSGKIHNWFDNKLFLSVSSSSIIGFGWDTYLVWQ